MDLPCGTRNYDYARDMAILRTKTHWALFICFLLVFFAAPVYLSSSWLGVTSLIGITIIAITGLNILIGYCGQLIYWSCWFHGSRCLYYSYFNSTNWDFPYWHAH